MIAIIQARMSSKRLPGKVLKKINGKPMLMRVVENVKKSKKIKKIYIATSRSPKDNKIVIFCKKNKLNFFKGALNNVSLRFKNFLEKKGSAHEEFIRINGDSPFIDPKLIDKFINTFKKKKPLILTNTYSRTFPKGQSIEIINSKFFIKNFKYFKLPDDKEHVTHFFYRKKFKGILNIKNKNNYSNINMCVDTKNDLRIARSIYKNFIEKKKNKFCWKNLTNKFNEKK